MKNFRYFAQRYVDWVIRLGRVRFSLLGIAILAILAICIQILLSTLLSDGIHWSDIARSITFGLFTAPFVIYFFTLLVERLERSRLELSKTLARLEKNSRDKSTLLATISHELRTPLNGIIGLSRILLDDKLTEQQQNYLNTINLSAVSLGHIFSDIIDLNKIDSKRIELNIQPCDFHSLLNDFYNFGTLMAEQKGLKFSLKQDENLPNWLYLDRARILWNLISNAVKFTEKGEVILRVQKMQDNHYQFSVTDTGAGIAPCELDKIFTMYYQVKDNIHRSAGSGIGLAISKNLAQLMQGDLTVESELDKGSTFYLTIIADQAQAHDGNVEKAMQHLSILLVEDVELNVIVAKSILEKQGHYVDVAMNGEEAIQLFEKNTYDIVFLDIKLPDMSGFDIAYYLRKNYEEGIYDFLPPLIAFTANVMHSEEEYQNQGMDGVLRKPLSLTELRQCFKTFLGDDIEITSDEEDLPQVQEGINISLIELIGKSQAKANIELFKQWMPIYLDELETAYGDYLANADMQQMVSDVAHKIKGAAASVGLVNVQNIAKQAQDTSLSNWVSDIASWIKQLSNEWPQNVAELEAYLEK
ncbi:MAG: ATP-binding protein [Haemophilus parainfluenzae]|nr:ATP-binding protein [Haemophilus parainfluenzae]